jgi:parallel beta-helix repeat protein
MRTREGVGFHFHAVSILISALLCAFFVPQLEWRFQEPLSSNTKYMKTCEQNGCQLLQIASSDPVLKNALNTSFSTKEIVVPDELATIQEAVDSANPGDTIFVRSGTYFENVVIKKPVTLIGEDASTTVIDGKQLSSTMYVQANNVVVSNFTLQNSKTVYPGSGVHIYGKYNTVVGNIIENNLIGIYLYYSQNNTLANNRISNSYYGVWADHVSSNNTIIGNTIFSNRQAGVHAGLASDNNTISANIFHNNTYGLFLPTSYNEVFHNNFVNNTHHAWSNAEGNRWDCDMEGNYWDNYQGRDLNKDGLGNEPYLIEELGQDNYPLLGSFSELDTGLNQIVRVISNSTIERLRYFDSNETISIHVSGETATIGFCRVSVPKILMNVSSLSIIIDNGLASVLYFNPQVFDDQTQRGIYVEYEHSSHEISIVSEHIPLTFACASMLVVSLFIIAKRKRCTDADRIISNP